MLYDDPEKRQGLKRACTIINKNITTLLRSKLDKKPLDKKNLILADSILEEGLAAMDVKHG